MFKYAQLLEDGTVVGISFLSGPVELPEMILLDGARDNDDMVDLGWRFVDGEWREPLPEASPEPSPEPSPGNTEE